ncbi:hypothetical protein HK101_004121 [Irineochytrium annulatum]|nr:hypothetical protein HK101_004121 [Irineochytrium annulatum]
MTAPTMAAKCIICYELTPSLSWPCAHRACATCLSAFITISPRDRPPFRCPSPGCPRKISLQQPRTVPGIDADLLTKLEDRVNQELQIRCGLAMRCPSAPCGGFIETDGLEEVRKYTRCPRCKTRVCPTCRVKWHKGRTCEDEMERSELSTELVRNLAEEEGWMGVPNPVVQLLITSFVDDWQI